MNWRPPTLEELTIGLPCEIIDMRASADNIQAVTEVKKAFKRDITPEIVYKSHILTASDIEYYALNSDLIKRDIRINKE